MQTLGRELRAGLGGVSTWPGGWLRLKGPGRESEPSVACGQMGQRGCMSATHTLRTAAPTGQCPPATVPARLSDTGVPGKSRDPGTRSDICLFCWCLSGDFLSLLDLMQLCWCPEPGESGTGVLRGTQPFGDLRVTAEESPVTSPPQAQDLYGSPQAPLLRSRQRAGTRDTAHRS